MLSLSKHDVLFVLHRSYGYSLYIATVASPPSTRLARYIPSELNGSVTFPAASTAIPAAVPNAVDMRQLILNQDREWIGALSRDIASHSSRDNHLQFTLMPESLGQLDVTLTTGKGQVDVRLDASTAAAAQIIVADQARLIEDLRNAGLKLGQFEMTNRQNSNGQQRQPTPDHPNIETTSITTPPVAQSKAFGRFA